MGNHATNCPIEYFGWCTVVERTRLFGVHDVALMEEVVISELKAH